MNWAGPRRVAAAFSRPLSRFRALGLRYALRPPQVSIARPVAWREVSERPETTSFDRRSYRLNGGTARGADLMPGEGPGECRELFSVEIRYRSSEIRGYRGPGMGKPAQIAGPVLAAVGCGFSRYAL